MQVRVFRGVGRIFAVTESSNMVRGQVQPGLG
jgi:hypothetical protein